MSKKIYITLLITVVLATATLFAATPALADNGPCKANANYPCDLDNFESFLLNQDSGGQCGNYFNPIGADSIEEVCEPLVTFDFDGSYYFTTIASEADNCLLARWPGTEAPSIVFSNQDFSNWGLLAAIDLTTATPSPAQAPADDPLVVEDVTSEIQFNLDPYCLEGSGDNCDRFKICRLTRNSNLLGYLPNPITLFAGDIIIGFDDNLGNIGDGRDGDFADMVMVLRPIEEPAPAEPLVTRQLINAEADFFLLYNLKGDSFDVVCAKLVDGEWVPAPGACTITTFALEDLTFDGGTLEFAPFNKPWGASESPGCSYVRTRSGSVKKVCR